MSFAAQIKSLFSIPHDNPELLRSQARAFSRQVPLLYFILVINTLALTSTQMGTRKNSGLLSDFVIHLE